MEIAPAAAPLPVSARVEHLYLSPGHNYFGHQGRPAGTHPLLAVDEVECLAGRGLRGDRFLDFKPGYRGQITFLAMEAFDLLCQSLNRHDRDPGVLRRNVFVRGLELNSLIGLEFSFQGVHFFGSAECSPCPWMDQAFAPGAEKFLRNRGGLRARILTSGRLHLG